LAEPNLRRIMTIWAIVIVLGIASSSAGVFWFANSEYNTGTLTVNCEVHTGETNAYYWLYLFIDGKKVAEENIGYYGYYYSDSVHFDPVDLRAGVSHEVQVRDDSGRRSEVANAYVGFQQNDIVYLQLGNLSRVSISVATTGSYLDLNHTAYLYVDGVEVDSIPTYEYGVEFEVYLPIDDSYFIEIICGQKVGSATIYVADYNEQFTIYL
jgi:hypothetical protein